MVDQQYYYLLQMCISSLSLVIQRASSLQEYHFCLNSNLCPTHSRSKSTFPLFPLLCFYSKSFFFPATMTVRESFNLRTSWIWASELHIDPHQLFGDRATVFPKWRVICTTLFPKYENRQTLYVSTAEEQKRISKENLNTANLEVL